MKFLFKLVLLVCFLSSLVLAEPAFPQLSGRVVDKASLLSSSQKQKLIHLLQAHEKQTTNQVVVVTLKTLQGYAIEEYGYQLGRHWGIGQKGKDNGVLLIVAPNERKVRIEVGYGLEGVLTDKNAHDIIQEQILPYFKRGNYSKGIELGVQAILSTLKGEHIVKKKKTESTRDYIWENIYGILFIAFSFVALVFEFIRSRETKGKRFFISAFISTIVAWVVYQPFHDIVVALIAWIFTFIQSYSFGSSGSGANYSSSGGSWGGGGSSFGGFSGGGGSFGGGGASGSW